MSRPMYIIPALLLVALFCFTAAVNGADFVITMTDSETPLIPLLGINAGPLPWGSKSNAELTSLYKQVGVTSIRTHDMPGALDMSTMYPDRTKSPFLSSSYNYQTSTCDNCLYGSDESFTAIVSGGFEPYFRIGDSAKIKPPTDSELSNWVSAAVEVIRHYNSTNSQWSANNIKYVEIGNEPNSQNFWPPPFTPQQFYKLYSDTAKAIKNSFPDLKVGGPGITQSGYESAYGKQWFQNFLTYIKSSGAPLDFFSWHIYSNSYTDYDTAMTFYRSQLDSYGFTNTTLHLTEWNASSSATQTEGEVRISGKAAAFNTAAWIVLQERNVEKAFMYRGSDQVINDVKQYGMFYTTGDKKKTALAFSLWSEVFSYANRTGYTTSGSTALKAMAVKNSDGRIAVLVANTGDKQVRWTVSLTGGHSLSEYAMTLKTVNDSSNQVQGATPSGTEFDIPAYSVQLLSIQPAANNNCAASLSGTLILHVPIVTYSGQAYWADLQYTYASDSSLVVTSAGLWTNTSFFRNCTSSDISPDLLLHIPVLVFNGVSYSADFQYSAPNFKLTNAKQN